VAEDMKKIMVVDDESDQLYTIEQTLKNANCNFEVILSNSGIDCLQKLKNNILPDIILLDIMMPGMSGWEVQKRIRSNPKFSEIPIVFLTARNDEVAKKAGKVLKPYFKKNAIFGITKKQDIFLKAVKLFSGINMKPFEDIESAKDWLVE
jgi:CheY-like chemotaxis protein